MADWKLQNAFACEKKRTDKLYAVHITLIFLYFEIIYSFP